MGIQPTKCETPWRCLGTRLVKSFKRAFYANIGKRRLSDKILTTTFYLIEQSLNDGPLVPASANAIDLAVSTPNHILLEAAGSTLPRIG